MKTSRAIRALSTRKKLFDQVIIMQKLQYSTDGKKSGSFQKTVTVTESRLHCYHCYHCTAVNYFFERS